LPELWRTAAEKALAGESVEELNLPRTRMSHGNSRQSGSQPAGLVVKDKKTAAVRFPYDQEILNRIKAEIDGRTWNAEAKCWEFPIVHLPKVVNIFGGLDNLKVTDAVKKAYKREQKRRSDLDEIRSRIESDLHISTLIPLYPFQRVGVEFALRAGGRAMIADAMGLGKAQPLDAKILTPLGWKLMGDIGIGDEVITPNGGIANVNGCFLQGEKEIYRITFSDKSSVECCLDHLWYVESPQDRYNNRKGKILTTKQLKDDLVDKWGNAKWAIPQVDCIDFKQNVELPLHPYVLGALIGDGGLTQGRVNFTAADKEMVSLLQECIPTSVKITASKHSKGIGYSIVWADSAKNVYNPIKEALEELQLMGKYSYEKEIPDQYMFTSLRNRIALFQGLMDTDGWYSSALQFGSTSEKLARQVKELIESFGGTAKMKGKRSTFNKKKYRTFWVLTIALPDNIRPFKLSRKAQNYPGRPKYKPVRYIKAIEICRQAEAKCISLDSEQQLYVTNNYIVTHNTVQAIGFALEKQAKTLVVCPKSVTLQWAEEIKKFTGKNSTIWTTQKVEGHGNNQFHIINYDAVRKQLKKLLQINWNLLVCDEATNLKNRRTLRAKSVLGSWKERRKYPGIKTDYVLFLTGTPILNRPIEAYYLLSFIDPQRFKNFYHFVQRYGGWKFAEPKNLEELHERTKDVVIRRLKKEVLPELPDKQRNDLFIELEEHERQAYNELLDDLFRTWHFNGKATVSTMPKIQGFLSNKKLERAKEIIDEFLEADRAILLFSIYIDPLKKLKKHYGDQAELLYGDTSAKERNAIVKRLVAGKSRVGLVGLHAGGMGLDGLQHVIDTVIFINQDWVPGIHEQAEDRTHRIGQKKKVQIFYLLCDKTIDEDMRILLAEKQKVIDTVADGKLVSSARSRSTFKEFVQRLSAKHGEDFTA